MSTPGPIALERFDVSEISSISAIFAAEGYSAGLYVLRFADGEAYVGHAADVAAQFSIHRTEWKDIVAIEFASWPGENLTDGYDSLSTLIEPTTVLRVRTTDAQAPTPSSDTLFPADRSARTTITSGGTDDRTHRFWELSDHIAYPEIRSVVADYINSTIPDPANTQKYLWNVTALPTTAKATGRRRLLTINCGGLETLFITEITHEGDEIELDLTINTDVPEGKSDSDLEISNDSVIAGRGSYKSERVWSWSIDLGALWEEDVEVDLGIDDDTFDDLAYALNVRLLAHKSSPYARYHNQHLANDLLAEAYRQANNT